jgi:hypothetical protein
MIIRRAYFLHAEVVWCSIVCSDVACASRAEVRLVVGMWRRRGEWLLYLVLCWIDYG